MMGLYDISLPARRTTVWIISGVIFALTALVSLVTAGIALYLALQGGNLLKTMVGITAALGVISLITLAALNDGGYIEP